MLTFPGSGEQDVGGAITLADSTVFNTYAPAATTCTSSLGTATQYIVNYRNAAATQNLNGDSVTDVSDRSQQLPGGGFVPTPVPVVVQSSSNPGKYVMGVVSGTNVYTFPTPPSARLRTYWRNSTD